METGQHFHGLLGTKREREVKGPRTEAA